MIDKGTKVSWRLQKSDIHETTRHGITVSDEHDGHVFVAVTSEGEEHHVIWCAVTWLTVDEKPADEAPVAAPIEAPPDPS